MRILLAEDDNLLGDGIQTALKREGYAIDWLSDGPTALQALQSQPFDAAILDLGLPRMDGLDVLRKARASGVQTAILVLTARDALEDKVKGLDSGADDYLLKPFDLDELQARLRALCRRAAGRTGPILRHGALELDEAAFSVRLHEQHIALARREFMTLKILLERAGRVVSRDALQQSLYGWGEDVDSNAVEVHIHHLRKKLYPELIRTVRGIGYTIDRA